MWTVIATWTGAIISIGTFIYFAGFWRRGVEDNIRQIQKDVSEIKGDLKEHNLSSFCLMVQTLWDVYVLDPLHKRPDIATSHSLPKLTQKGLGYIPEDVKTKLDELAASVKSRPSGYLGLSESANLVVQVIGLDGITKIAGEKELSIQETIAVLSTYLSNKLG